MCDDDRDHAASVQEPGRAREVSSEAHPLLTVAETAQMLRVSKMTIHRRIAARTIPALCIGRSPRIPRDFVQGLLDAARAGQTVVIEELAATGSGVSTS